MEATTYHFDAVFDESVDNDFVYDGSSCRDLVQAVVNGVSGRCRPTLLRSDTPLLACLCVVIKACLACCVAGFVAAGVAAANRPMCPGTAHITVHRSFRTIKSCRSSMRLFDAWCTAVLARRCAGPGAV